MNRPTATAAPESDIANVNDLRLKTSQQTSRKQSNT